MPRDETHRLSCNGALVILVKFPWATRRWALPILVALYVAKSGPQRRACRHRTPAELIRRTLAVLLPWFPKRPFIFAGDAGFGTHELSHTNRSK